MGRDSALSQGRTGARAYTRVKAAHSRQTSHALSACVFSSTLMRREQALVPAA